MRFGYYLLNTYVPELDGLSPDLYAHWLEQIDAAEEFGFDSLWVTEHHFRLFGGMIPNPQLLLAAAAQRTSRLRLGSSVSLVPMHHPIRIAEDFAMLDLVSNGRALFGGARHERQGVCGFRRRLGQRTGAACRGARSHRQGLER